MNTFLRQKRIGNQERWKREEIEAGFKHFFTEFGRYPTANEIDFYPYLPSVRTIERSFGGLVSFRKATKQEGQNDYRKGVHSSNRALLIGKKSRETETKIYNELVKKFGVEFVHREYLFTYDARTRADFFVYTANGNFCVDVFFPSDIRNFIGCINSKIGKYAKPDTKHYPIILLNLNDAIDELRIESYLRNRKTSIPPNIMIMTHKAFIDFCNKKQPNRVF